MLSMLLFQQQLQCLLWEKAQNSSMEEQLALLCANLKGLDVLIWQCVQNKGVRFSFRFLFLGFISSPRNQGGWTRVHLAAGGVIDFICILVQNVSNQISANTGNYKILLSQPRQKSQSVKPSTWCENECFRTASQTKSLLTFVPWAKQCWVTSVQTCLQSLEYRWVKMLILLAAPFLPSLWDPINPHTPEHWIIPGLILGNSRIPLLPYYQLHG